MDEEVIENCLVLFALVKERRGEELQLSLAASDSREGLACLGIFVQSVSEDEKVCMFSFPLGSLLPFLVLLQPVTHSFCFSLSLLQLLNHHFTVYWKVHLNIQTRKPPEGTVAWLHKEENEKELFCYGSIKHSGQWTMIYLRRRSQLPKKLQSQAMFLSLCQA